MTIRNAASNMTAALLQTVSIRRPSSQQSVLATHSRSICKLLILALAVSLYGCGRASEASKDTAVSKPAGSSASKSSSPWGGFKVGSFVKTKTTVSTQMMGRTTDTSTETTTTLADLTADKAVLDIEASVMGHTTKTRTEVPLTGGSTTGSGATTGTQNPATGSETIVVAGKSLDCKTYEVDTDAGGNKVKTKTWISDQIPGFVVKSVATTTGAMASTTTMEAVDFKAN